MAKHNQHGSKWIRKERRWAIYLRDDFHCLFCDRMLEHAQDGGELTLDHLDEDGGNHESNLVTSCRTCNIAKGGITARGFASPEALGRIDLAVTKAVDIEAARLFLRNKESAGAERLSPATQFPEIRASPRDMAALGKTSDKRLHLLAQNGEIPQPTAEGYDVIRTLSALLGVRREGSPGDAYAMDKARKMKADADTAEVEAAKAMEEAVLTDDAEALWADAITRARGVIEYATYLREDQKDSILADLAKITLTEDEPK